MNTLMNINPWQLFENLFDVESPTFKNVQARVAGRFPPMNAYVSDNAIIIDLELPGKTAADVDLSLEAQAVIIAAHTESAAENDDRKRTPPAWRRRIELPFKVEDAKVTAKFTDGILRIELPRKQDECAKRITIG